MTRVTNDLRNSLLQKIMAGLPVIDYIPQIHELVQQVVIDHAPAEVKVIYDNPDPRHYLANCEIEVKVGNKNVPMWLGDYSYRTVKGPGERRLGIQMHDAANAEHLSEGSLYQALIAKLKESGLVDAYFAQDELRHSVRKRLTANLGASSTFKQLYVNLEPELHHYIPKDEVRAQVPTCVAPVVDDLRKLGAVLPETPKAEG